MTRDDEQRIADMLEVAEQIAELVQRGRAAFASDIAVRFPSSGCSRFSGRPPTP